MYSPRNGTIRGPGSASDGRPDGRTGVLRRQRVGRRLSEPVAVVTVTRPPVRSMPVTASRPVGSVRRRLRSRRRIVRAITTKSVIAVSGECIAASPVACGSMSVMPAGSTRGARDAVRTGGLRRAVQASRTGCSPFRGGGPTATTQLPHSVESQPRAPRSTPRPASGSGTAIGTQFGFAGCPACSSDRQRAGSTPSCGRIWWTATRSSFSNTMTLGYRAAAYQPRPSARPRIRRRRCRMSTRHVRSSAPRRPIVTGPSASPRERRWLRSTS